MPKQLIKVVVILILSIFSNSLNAQTDSSKADKGININFFNGYALSYKWNASQNFNYRVYLNLSSYLYGVEYDTKNINSGSQNRSGTSNDESTTYAAALSFHFLYNIIFKKSLNFYIGIGPNLNYSYKEWETTDKNDDFDGSNYTTYYSNSNKEYGIGIIALLGIEAFLTKKISFFAETHLSGFKSWNYLESINNRNINTPDAYNNKIERSGTGWNFNFQLVKVGLGIYF